MKATRFMSTMLLTACICGAASADDGAIANKSMDGKVTDTKIQLPDFGQDIVNNAVPEAEHAFTDMMGFYVPAQAASGLVEPVAYCDADNQPEPGEDCTNPVETLDVAKPLVNVFLYGPHFPVHGTAFAHRFFDTYAAVSLDDGETWKTTNLSRSAHLSSFNIETDHMVKKAKDMPADHNQLLGSKNNGAMHALGYDAPYTAHCTECHGPGLTGTTQAPSCYSCHESRWKEEPFPGTGPIVYEAIYKNSKLQGFGENAVYGHDVMIVNAITGDELFEANVTLTGTFSYVEMVGQKPPCTVAAISDGDQGPALVVTDKFGEPLAKDQCEGSPVDITNYPGGSYNVFHATAGNKVLVAWPSRYCETGQPAYSLTTSSDNDTGLSVTDKQARLDAIEALISVGDETLGVTALSGFTAPSVTADGADLTDTDDLYLVDAFGVAGTQRSIDFADEGYPQAGVVPFGCVWTARGILLPGDDPRTDEVESSHMVWTNEERLTSGLRDVNRIEVKAAKGAGFVITWQEDPEGLRPGQGLGPGEGWSGAIAHPQTDVWYSFINEEYFDIVQLENEDSSITAIDVLDHDLLSTGRPKAFVPMSVPMRLTNNAKCIPPSVITAGGGEEDLYCGSGDTADAIAAVFGLKDQCADTVTILTGNPNSADGETETEICVADSDGDGAADLPNRANTAATRPRTSLQGYDTDADGASDSAWVVVAMERSKGLGKYFFTPDSDGDGYAQPCEEGDEAPCTEEIGKNQWYFSFDMGTPDTSAGIDNDQSLVENLVSQGNMLNQGEVYWETGELFGLMSTADMEDYEGYNFDILNTEIARRASLLVQSVAKASASANGLAAMPSWKQGVMRQGGPADTMVRRIVVPDDFDPAVDNPYAFENMACSSYLIAAGTNPYYPGGVCADPATNLSAVIPDTCADDDGGGEIPCPTVDFSIGTYGAGSLNPVLRGIVQGEGDTTRVLTWHQCPSEGTQTVGDITAVTCGTVRTDDFVDAMQDQSWYNPLDVSKGHRGFIDGDFVQILYGWSPNWRLNAKGKDRYELYIRRSFDGGLNWTTTPDSFTASDGNSYSGDGTITCETYRTDSNTVNSDAPKVCYEFTAGAAEHARNVTQHRSMKITTLDPRYAPTKATITDGCTDGLFVDPTVIDGIFTCDDLSDDLLDSDLRDPSRFFIVFETGDNSTVEVGEAEPLDLYYSRAESFGDDYVVWTETDTASANPEDCYPNVAYDVINVAGTVLEGSGFCNEFDRLNTAGDTHSSEANLEANPDGSKMYGVWAQWVFDEHGEEVAESDAMARRIWWIDDFIPDDSYILPGTNQPE